VRVVDVFVDELDLVKLGFDGVIPAETGRPAYHPAILLKFYSTAISTAFGRADALNEKPDATSS
jgi:transposase